MGGILIVVIVVFGVKVLFGRGKVEDYYKFLVWLIFAPVLLAIGFNHIVWFWYGLPPWVQMVSVFFLPFLALGVLRILFPKAAWLQKLLIAVFETLIYAVTFPFRLIWRAGRFTVQRERRTNRLEPFHPQVGRKPPLKEQSERPKNHNNSF